MEVSFLSYHNSSHKVLAINIASLDKRRILFKAFVESQFAYSPLVWMFHSRSLNKKIKRIHERALRMVYDDDKSTFNELLVRDGSFTIHERNIQ